MSYPTFWCHYVMMSILYDVIFHYDIITLHYAIILCHYIMALGYDIIMLHYGVCLMLLLHNSNIITLCYDVTALC